MTTLLTARFAFEQGPELQINSLNVQQKKDILEAIKNKKPYLFEEGEKVLWANFKNIRSYSFMPNVSNDAQASSTDLEDNTMDEVDKELAEM
jgi:hypothetical protein